MAAPRTLQGHTVMSGQEKAAQETIGESLSGRDTAKVLHWLLAAALLALFVVCLWLFWDIWAARNDLQAFLRQRALPPTGVSGSLLADMKDLYRQEITLNLVLASLILVMGVLLGGYVSHWVRLSGRMKDIQNIDRYILQSITRGVVTVDERRRITSCNRAFGEILGLSASLCSGRSFSSVFPEESPFRRMVEWALQSPGNMDAEDEIVYTTPEGEEKPLRLTTCALRNEKGRLIGVILLVKDLTPIKALEERLRRQERLAAIGHLTRRILHEVRNPLSAMDLNLQLLQERLEVLGFHDPKAERYLRVVFSELHRLDKVVGDTHHSVTPPPVHLRPVVLQDVLTQVAEGLRASFEKDGHRLVLDLWPEPLEITADSDRLKEVLINLLLNAQDAVAGRTGRVILRCRLEERTNRVVVEVEDNGAGIPWENLSKIFDPYFTTKRRGTGLGLSVVHNIVKQHGGEIHVSSWVDEGTIFAVHLPGPLSSEMPSH
jgi:PAS domain S-box-containing protein